MYKYQGYNHIRMCGICDKIRKWNKKFIVLRNFNEFGVNMGSNLGSFSKLRMV